MRASPVFRAKSYSPYRLGLLRKTVEAAVVDWKFPIEGAGKEIRATLEFKTNCPSTQR